MDTPISTPTSSLHTDRYELTMLDVALGSGLAHQQAVFELFTRSLPNDRSYGVVAGTGRAIEAIANFRFGQTELSWLEANQIVSPRALDYLAQYQFRGNVWGYREGEVYLANAPVLTVEATFAQAVVLETILLSIFNHDSAVAAAAARMVDAADGRGVLEGGSRRVHEDAAVAAARAAYLAGASATSNLAAGQAYDIPTVGTIAHAFILAHPSEREAFAAQYASLGADTIFLVDTYDIAEGIRAAVDVAGPELGGVRIDSGDLALEATRARWLLDGLGATKAKIVASGDLDEWSIQRLAGAPIDAYLVGTRLVAGSGHPTASMVYKLVAVGNGSGELTPVAKSSSGKTTSGGRKAAFRVLSQDGRLAHDLLVADDATPIDRVPGPGRPLQVPLMVGGEPLDQPSLAETRAYSGAVRAELPVEARLPDPELSFATDLVTPVAAA